MTWDFDEKFNFFTNEISFQIDLQWMVLSCDATRPLRQNCEELPVILFISFLLSRHSHNRIWMFFAAIPRSSSTRKAGNCFTSVDHTSANHFAEHSATGVSSNLSARTGWTWRRWCNLFSVKWQRRKWKVIIFQGKSFVGERGSKGERGERGEHGFPVIFVADFTSAYFLSAEFDFICFLFYFRREFLANLSSACQAKKVKRKTFVLDFIYWHWNFSFFRWARFWWRERRARIGWIAWCAGISWNKRWTRRYHHKSGRRNSWIWRTWSSSNLFTRCSRWERFHFSINLFLLKTTIFCRGTGKDSPIFDRTTRWRKFTSIEYF